MHAMFYSVLGMPCSENMRNIVCWWATSRLLASGAQWTVTFSLEWRRHANLSRMNWCIGCPGEWSLTPLPKPSQFPLLSSKQLVKGQWIPQQLVRWRPQEPVQRQPQGEVLCLLLRAVCSARKDPSQNWVEFPRWKFLNWSISDTFVKIPLVPCGCL